MMMAGAGIAGPFVVRSLFEQRGGLKASEMALTAQTPSRVAETVVGQQAFVQTSRHQTTPPGQLGAGTVVDRNFARTIGDHAPAPGSNRTTPAGPWRPLWQEKWLIEGNRKQEHDWNFRSPHSRLEEVTMQYPYLATSNTGRAHTIPTEKPVPVQRLVNSAVGEIKLRPQSGVAR